MLCSISFHSPISKFLQITSHRFINHKNPHQPFHCLYHSHNTSPLIHKTRTSSNRGCSSMVFDGGYQSEMSEEDEEDVDGEALDTVLKLYSAITNKNIHEVADIIGDECRCVCNFFSFFQHVQGKKQVVDFFSYLIRSLGNNIEFVVKPTLNDGMHIGVQWKLEWKKKNVQIGKGFSFYICQVYHGKVFIRNVEMFMEPLLHIEPYRLRLLDYIMTMMDQLSSKYIIKRGMYILISLCFISLLIFFSKPGLY